MTLESNGRGLKVVGTRPIRPDGVKEVTGRANFSADRALPGMLYGKIKRGLYAYARIVKISTERALDNPGFLDYRVPVAKGLADDRRGHRRSAEPAAPVRRPRGRRGPDRPANGGGRQRDPRRDRNAVAQPADVATKILAEIDAEEPRRLAAE